MEYLLVSRRDALLNVTNYTANMTLFRNLSGSTVSESHCQHGFYHKNATNSN
jgi:hypothetical protein